MYTVYRKVADQTPEVNEYAYGGVHCLDSEEARAIIGESVYGIRYFRSCWSFAVKKTDRPNLLYILSDQHSPRSLGCYGDSLVRTPNLDSLAESGITFDNAYCGSPLCVPSRMAMLTGRYPHETGVWENDHILDSAIPTFAHAMGAAGYRPALVGRMHSVGPDQLHGYAERYVGDHRPNIPGGRPADHGAFEGCQGPKRISLDKSGVGQSGYEVHDEDVAHAAVQYLNRVGAEKRTRGLAQPFCLSVGFMLPHQPFLARREDFELYRDAVQIPRTYAPTAEGQHPWIKKWREKTGIVDVSEAEVLRARAAYFGLVTSMDRMIGSILDALDRNSLADNTAIIYLSDHGEQLGEHGLWWKQTFYESSVKVPGIISWPGTLPAGRRMDEVVSMLDFNATMLDMLDAPALPDSRGRSLMPLMTGAATNWDNVAYSEFCGPGYIQRMIRKDNWKLNYYHGYPAQLFDLANDPDELQDVSNEPKLAQTRDELEISVLDGWNPNEIEQRLTERAAEMEIIRTWATNTQPEDTHRWELMAGMDYLE